MKCSMLALQNAPIGAFCNASMLYLAVNCWEFNLNQVFMQGFLGFILAYIEREVFTVSPLCVSRFMQFHCGPAGWWLVPTRCRAPTSRAAGSTTSAPSTASRRARGTCAWAVSCPDTRDTFRAVASSTTTRSWLAPEIWPGEWLVWCPVSKVPLL